MFHVASLINRDGLFQSQYKKFAFSTNDFMEQLDNFESPWFSAFSKVRNETLNFFDVIWLKNYYAVLTQTLWKGGFCYTFNFPEFQNMFYTDKIVKDFFYKEHAPSESFGKYSKFNSALPFKSPLPGNGLEIKYNNVVFVPTNRTINSNFNDFTYGNGHIYFNLLNFTIPKTSFGGFNLIFHDNYEIIPWNDKIFHSNPDMTMKLLITPSIKRIDDSLKIRNINERHCYLPNERKLMFLKVYNKVNCEHECLTAMTLNTCRCVQFFMVRSKNTRVCGFKDEKCYLEVEGKFITNKHICKCYENCEVVKYDVQVTLTQKNKHKQFDLHRLIDSQIIIEMSTQVAVVVSERQSTNIIDFLSLSGGFFGLFAGFSVLSAAEIIYYFFISPIIEYRTEKSSRVYPIQEEVRSDNQIIKYFKQILQESTVHSFIHISNDQKGIIERLVWLILFIGSMICTSLMVIQVFGLIDINTVSISMEGTATNIEEIPFPAFTIQGSLNNVVEYITLDLNKLFKYINITNKLEDDHLKIFDLGGDSRQVIAIICGATHTDDLQNNDYKFKSFTEGYEIWMNNTHQENWFNSHFAKWNMKEIVEFAKIMTKFGYSYTFNMIESSKLLKANVSDDLKYSYDKNVDYPWRAQAGENKGFSLTFSNTGKAFECAKSSIAIHSPYDLPNSHDFIAIEDRHEYEIKIVPTVTKTDENLRHMSLDSRKCYFDDEKELKFFKIYTQKNCEFECLAHALYQTCKCVPFYYIRSSSWEICNFWKMKSCIAKYLYIKTTENVYLSKNCNCLPACNFVTYTYEIIQYKFADEHKNSVRHYMKNLKVQRNLSLRAHYKDSEYYTLMRQQEFKLVDFLSYVGGILGLFAGISALSIVELVYFVTLRLFTDLWRHFHS